MARKFKPVKLRDTPATPKPAITHNGEKLVRVDSPDGTVRAQFFRRSSDGGTTFEVFVRYLRQDGTPFSERFQPANPFQLITLAKADVEL
ncbi:hypothetical protein BH11PLA2_BH11PLA2_23300 [soil metagenome]